MRKRVIRGVVATALFVSFVVALTTVLTPETAAGGGQSCEQACYRDYQQCVPFCSKNPCLVSCETVLEICLSGCGSGS
ncbi:MAG: hypothetical protein ACREAA_13035 [Candidatus Polarisedimenticolia bacterium]